MALAVPSHHTIQSKTAWVASFAFHNFFRHCSENAFRFIFFLLDVFSNVAFEMFSLCSLSRVSLRCESEANPKGIPVQYRGNYL